MECGTEILKMNFILPHSFELDLPRDKLLSTLVELLFCYSNKLLRTKGTFIRTISGGSIWIAGVLVDRQVVVFSHFWCSRLAQCCCVFIRGKHPVCGEPLFCFSANPDSLSTLCGFHIDHRSRSFLLQVSGISSLLSFCCTSLVSGFIIHIPARFVYSQSAQGYKHKIVQFLKNSR